jgi:translation initiation factor IF-3
MIQVREVRVIDDERQALGVLPTVQAIQLARDRGLDLVEIAPTADPPVCKITDYGKFLYEQHKKDHEAKKHQKQIQIKEIKFRPKISVHDYDFKMKHVKRFLGEGNKVKITVMLRGREKQKPELGYQVLDRVLADVKDMASQDGSARKQDWAVSALLVPTKTGGKDAKAKNPQGSPKEIQGHGQEKVPA